MPRKDISFTAFAPRAWLSASLLALFIAPVPAAAALFPELTREAFMSDLPARVEEAKARPGANPQDGKLKTRGRILVAPVVLHWGYEFGNRPWPPKWRVGDTSPNVQAIADNAHKLIVGGLQKRGYVDVTPSALKAGGAAVDTLGDTAPSRCGRDHAGRGVSCYVYYSGKLKKWDYRSYDAMRRQFGVIEAVVFPEMVSTWLYRSHNVVNGEVMLVFDVFTVFEIKVCSGMNTNDCRTARIAEGKPVQAILPMPAEKFDNEKAHFENNALAIDLAGRYFGETVLAFIDNIASPPPKAP